jgi:hypothetical protein
MDFLKRLFSSLAPRSAAESGELVEWSEREVAEMSLRELQKDLKKRHLDTRGTKKMLKRRLIEAVEKQRDLRLNNQRGLERQRLVELMREARGAVYAIGRNDRGQLGTHDKEHRYAFVLLKELYDGVIVKVRMRAALPPRVGSPMGSWGPSWRLANGVRSMLHHAGAHACTGRCRATKRPAASLIASRVTVLPGLMLASTAGCGWR